MITIAWLFLGAFAVATIVAALFARAALHLAAELQFVEERLKLTELRHAEETQILVGQLRPDLRPGGDAA